MQRGVVVFGRQYQPANGVSKGIARVHIAQPILCQLRAALFIVGGARIINSVMKPGLVSDDCARHLTGIALAARLRSGKQVENADQLHGLANDILGVEIRTALSSTDIPVSGRTICATSSSAFRPSRLAAEAKLIRSGSVSRIRPGT